MRRVSPLAHNHKPCTSIIYTPCDSRLHEDVASRWADSKTHPDADLAWAAGDNSMFVACLCHVADACPAPQHPSNCALNSHAPLLHVPPPTSAHATQARRRLPHWRRRLQSAIMLSSSTARTPCAIASATLFELGGRVTWKHSIFRHNSSHLQHALRTSLQRQLQSPHARLTKPSFPARISHARTAGTL